MPDIKFSCPTCQQHIQAEPGYCGMQIACPACRTSIIVPGTPVARAMPAAPVAQPAFQPPPPPAGVARGVASGYPGVAGRMVPTRAKTPIYKTLYPYLGAMVLTLAVLYFLGRTNPVMMLACVGIGSLYVLVVQIMVIVSAFKESIGQGFLTLCVPFYSLWYVFKVSENPTLQTLYSLALTINIGLIFIPKSALPAQ